MKQHASEDEVKVSSRFLGLRETYWKVHGVLERGGCDKSTAGRRVAALSDAKVRVPNTFSKLCELFVGGAHFLQHHSHPPTHPPNGVASCPEQSPRSSAAVSGRRRAGIDFRQGNNRLFLKEKSLEN